AARALGAARSTWVWAPDGGLLDALLVSRLADQEFLVVANAANTDVVLRALADRARGDVKITDRTADYALIALQGPAAARILAPVTDADLSAVKYYAASIGRAHV